MIQPSSLTVLLLNNGFGATTSERTSTRWRTTTTFKTLYLSANWEQQRRKNCVCTTSEVHGHPGNPLPKKADRLAVVEADTESDDEDILYPGGQGQKMVFNWVDHAGKPIPHTWCHSLKKRIKTHEEKMAWQMSSRKIHAKEFLAECSASTERYSALLHMGLGSMSLDAQPHSGAISCQIESQEMGTHFLATASTTAGKGRK